MKTFYCSNQRISQRYDDSFFKGRLNMDIVFVKGLKIDTVIGIYDWERKIRQDIILDIEMSSDIATFLIFPEK